MSIAGPYHFIGILKTQRDGEYLKGVIETLEKGKSALVDGLEARRSLEIITAIYESVETGREISVKFMPEKCRLGLPRFSDS